MHFGFMVLGCVDAFREKRRGRFGGLRLLAREVGRECGERAAGKGGWEV